MQQLNLNDHIGSCTECKKTSFPSRQFLAFVRVCPAIENSRSEGTDVATVVIYILVISDSIRYEADICFQKSKGFCWIFSVGAPKTINFNLSMFCMQFLRCYYRTSMVLKHRPFTIDGEIIEHRTENIDVFKTSIIDAHP